LTQIERFTRKIKQIICNDNGSFSCSPITASDKTYNDYEYAVWYHNDIPSLVEIKEYNVSQTELSIPSEIDGKPVEILISGAFSECKTLKSFYSQCGNKIEVNVFGNCYNLRVLHRRVS